MAELIDDNDPWGIRSLDFNMLVEDFDLVSQPNTKGLTLMDLARPLIERVTED